MQRSERAALIGDLIASRRVGPRLEIQKAVEADLDRVNRRLHPEQPLRFTIGDEFQAVFRTMEEALEAIIWIRVETIATIGVRMGIGWGWLEMIDAERSPMLQDGPCWWRARDAIDEVGRREHANLTPNSTRVLVRTGDDGEGAFNAGLILLDSLLGQLRFPRCHSGNHGDRGLHPR